MMIECLGCGWRRGTGEGMTEETCVPPGLGHLGGRSRRPERHRGSGPWLAVTIRNFGPCNRPPWSADSQAQVDVCAVLPWWERPEE